MLDRWAPCKRARAAAHVLPDALRCSSTVRPRRCTASTSSTTPSSTYRPTLEVASVDGAGRTRRDGVLGGKRDLRPDEIMTIGGVQSDDADPYCVRHRLSARPAAGDRDAGCVSHQVRHQPSRALDTRCCRATRRRRGVTQLRELIPLSQRRCRFPARIVDPHRHPRRGVPDARCPGVGVGAWLGAGQGRERVRAPPDRGRVRRRGVSLRGRAIGHGTRPAARRCARAGWIIIVVRRDGLSRPPGASEWLARACERRFAERAPYPVDAACLRALPGQSAGRRRRDPLVIAQHSPPRDGPLDIADQPCDLEAARH